MHRFAADTVSAATQGNWTQDGDGNWIQQKATQKSLRQTNMSTADRGRLLGEPATSSKVAHRSWIFLWPVDIDCLVPIV